MSLAPFRCDASGTIFLAVLACQDKRMPIEIFVIIFQRLSGLEVQYARVALEVLLFRA